MGGTLKGAEVVTPDEGMVEAFLKTLKRDYARVSPGPNAVAVLRQLDGWFEHYNTGHPHKAWRRPRAARVPKTGVGERRERGRRSASTG